MSRDLESRVRGKEEIILTLEGAAVRLKIPEWQCLPQYHSTYRKPDVRYVTGTIARQMRREYASAIYRKMVELERVEHV